MEIQKKLKVLELAESLGNVSEAAKISGVSRDTIYRHRKLVKEGGIKRSQCLAAREYANHWATAAEEGFTVSTAIIGG